MKPILKIQGLTPTELTKCVDRVMSTAPEAVRQVKEFEGDPILLFPAEMQPSNSIVIELQHPVRSIHQCYCKDHSILASMLGHLLLSIFPEKYVQCHIIRGVHLLTTWSSDTRVTQGELMKILAWIQEALPTIKEKAETHCRCEENATDFKGPCSYHNSLGAYNHFEKELERILALENGYSFQVQADVLMIEIRGSYLNDDLQKYLQQG